MAISAYLNFPYSGQKYGDTDQITCEFQITGVSGLSTSDYTMALYYKTSANGSIKAIDTSTDFTISSGSWYCEIDFNAEELGIGTYYLVGRLMKNLGWSEAAVTGTVKISIEEAYAPAIYYAKLIINGNGGTCDGEEEKTFSYWNTSWDDYATVSIKYDASDFTREGYVPLGLDLDKSVTSPEESISGTHDIDSYSTSENRPEKVTLYVIWKEANLAPWEWTSTVEAGKPFEFTAKEWNDFMARIKAYADSKNIYIPPTILAATRATKDNPMLAIQAQNMCTLLTLISAKPPTSPSPNDFITASFINGLKDAFNDLL